jgi:phenylpropionate dioxygenase-like ring-hydroxylating dioxygenase large terminal subunit
VFLRNAWYVAARDAEISNNLLPVQLLGERLVLYRTSAGQPAALEDACPHRRLPLSMGRLVGDQIECGYHGLAFDCSGRCTRVPGSSTIPVGARVRSYPTISKYGFLWIWMGDPLIADPNRMVLVEHWDDPAWGKNRGGAMDVDCNYLFITDNLLDPSHVAWVHRTSFGNEACQGEPIRSTASADGVIAARWMYNVEVAPFYVPLVGFDGRCDRLQHYEVRFPSYAVIKAIFAPAGTGGEGKPLHEKALIMDSYNFMTPIDENRTRYYWFQIRNVSPRDETLSQLMDDGVAAAFAEDCTILAAVQRGFLHHGYQHIDLATDRAPSLFRRRLLRLISAEHPTTTHTDPLLSTTKPRHHETQDEGVGSRGI